LKRITSRSVWTCDDPPSDAVFVEIGLELVEQDVELALVEFPERGDRRRVDDDGALAFENGDCLFGQHICGRAVAKRRLRTTPMRAPRRPSRRSDTE
jgi:hypothetical protein